MHAHGAVFTDTAVLYVSDNSPSLYPGSPTRLAQKSHVVNGYREPQNLPRIYNKHNVTANRNKSYSENFSTSDYESGVCGL